MEELQLRNYEFARTTDLDLARKLRNRYDTRAAAVMESMQSRFRAANVAKPKPRKLGIETWLFGPPIMVNNNTEFDLI